MREDGNGADGLGTRDKNSAFGGIVMENCIESAREHVNLTRNALQTVFDELNHGQQKKILRNEKVRQILEAYGVDISSAKEK